MRYLQAGDDLEELWDEIAQQIPRRDATQCSSRWKNMLNPDLVKGPWTKARGGKKDDERGEKKMKEEKREKERK